MQWNRTYCIYKNGWYLPATLYLEKLEYADDIAIIDESCTEASQRLSSLHTGARYESGLVVATSPNSHPHTCPAVVSLLAIRKWGGTHRYDWHMCTVVRINGRNGTRVYVEYFVDEQREPLRLSEKQRGIMAYHLTNCICLSKRSAFWLHNAIELQSLTRVSFTWWHSAKA